MQRKVRLCLLLWWSQYLRWLLFHQPLTQIIPGMDTTRCFRFLYNFAHYMGIPHGYLLLMIF